MNEERKKKRGGEVRMRSNTCLPQVKQGRARTKKKQENRKPDKQTHRHAQNASSGPWHVDSFTNPHAKASTHSPQASDFTLLPGVVRRCPSEILEASKNQTNPTIVAWILPLFVFNRLGHDHCIPKESGVCGLGCLCLDLSWSSRCLQQHAT